MTETKFINTKNENSHTGAIVFLLVVIFSSVGLFFFNGYLEDQNTNLDVEIAKENNIIKELEANDQLQVFALVEANQLLLKELEKRNKVTSFINHLESMNDEYNIKTEGFKLTNGSVSTTVFTESNDDGIAYTKTRDFIKNYRTNTGALFDLDFVTDVEGMDNMKFNISLNIK